MDDAERWSIIRFCHHLSGRWEKIDHSWVYESEAWAIAHKLNNGFSPRDLGLSAYIERF